MRKFIAAALLIIAAITFGVYQINKIIDEHVEIESNILANEKFAKLEQKHVEMLGHKYAEQILAQHVLVEQKNEEVRGHKEPQFMTDKTKYVEKYMVLETTAYWTMDPVEASGDGIAFDGTPAIAYQTCAIDPKVIPLQSEIYVPTIGWMRANDTGNAIKGKILDVAMPSRDDAWNWGRRYVYAKVRIPAQKTKES